MSLCLNVPQVLARNPVARAVERANLRRWFTSTALQVETMDDGEPCESLLTGLAEAIAMAIKASETFDDPEDVRGTLLQAMGHLVRMTQPGRFWSREHAGEISEALDIAVQLLACSDPRDKLKAWEWVVKAARSEVVA